MGMFDPGGSDADTSDAGSSGAEVASWPPEGRIPCGPVYACRANLKQGDACVLSEAPRDTVCSVLPNGSGGHQPASRGPVGGRRARILHNTYNPPENLMGVSTPNLRAPAHGWLTPRGNHAGGLAPE